MKHICSRIVVRMIHSVTVRKSHDHQPLKIIAALGAFFFIIIYTASIFTQRNDVDFVEVYIGLSLTLLLMYPLFRLTTKLIEDSHFPIACQHIVMGRWEFVFHYATKHPHTKKFYSNPAGLLLMAIVLKMDGYIEESTFVLKRAISAIPEFEDIYIEAPCLNQKSINHMIKVWGRK